MSECALLARARQAASSERCDRWIGSRESGHRAYSGRVATHEARNEVAVAHDWWESGWNHILPRQAFWLHILVATATLRSTDGSLDQLVRDIGIDWFDRHSGGLDGPISFSFPDSDPTDLEQIELDEQTQFEFESAMARAGRPALRTVRQLAHLMADLGLFENEVDPIERWRAPETMPLVAERLPMPEAFAAAQDEWRWRSLHEASAQAIIRHVIETLDSPEQVATRLSRFAREAGLDLVDLRFGIAALIEDGDFALLDARDGEPLDPETVEEVRSVVVAIDWNHFAEHRISIRTAVPNGEE
jgi:Family of unknown function (DUF6042)